MRAGLAAGVGAASAIGTASGVMECTLLWGGAGLDVSEGDQWQMCVLTPRPGSVSPYTPWSFSVELKEMNEGLSESFLHWPMGNSRENQQLSRCSGS